MSDITASVGTKFSVVAASPATYDTAGFGALTYVLVGEAAEIPSFGAEAALATHTALADGVVRKRRGSVNYGSITVPLALTGTDAGEAILKAAGLAAPGANSLLSIEIELPNGDIQYFEAETMSFKTNVGNADAITMAEVTLEITSAVVFD